MNKLIKQDQGHISIQSTQPNVEESDDNICKIEYQYSEEIRDRQRTYNQFSNTRNQYQNQVKEETREEIDIKKMQLDLESYYQNCLNDKKIMISGLSSSQEKQEQIISNRAAEEQLSQDDSISHLHPKIHKYISNLLISKILRESAINLIIQEKYIPEISTAQIQVFELETMICLYQLNFTLEQIKDSHIKYDQMLLNLMEILTKENNCIDIYFFDYGKVLKSFCLVGNEQMKVYEKALNFIEKWKQNCQQITLILGGLDDFQEQIMYNQLSILLPNFSGIQYLKININQIFRYVFFSLQQTSQSQIILQSYQQFRNPADIINNNVNVTYYKLSLQQRQFIQLESVIRNLLKVNELKSIMNQYFINPEHKLSILGFYQILMNMLNYMQKMNNIIITQSNEDSNLINLLTISKNLLLKQPSPPPKNEIKQIELQFKQKTNKMVLKEFRKYVIVDFAFFTDEGNRHFPEKRQNCVKCKVCRRKYIAKEIQSIHKTKYRCRGCFIKYQRNINLCITPCFEEFHVHPEKYLTRGSKLRSLSDSDIEVLQKKGLKKKIKKNRFNNCY